MSYKKDKKGVNPVAVAIAGAAVGAAAAALANKDTREKLGKKVSQMRKKGERTLNDAQRKVNKAKERSKKRLVKKLSEE